MTHLCYRADVGRRIAHDGDFEICVDTGEVVGCGIEIGYKR